MSNRTRTAAEQMQEHLTAIGRLFVQSQDVIDAEVDRRIGAAVDKHIAGNQNLTRNCAALEAEIAELRNRYSNLDADMLGTMDTLEETRRERDALELGRLAQLQKIVELEDDAKWLRQQLSSVQADLHIARNERDEYLRCHNELLADLSELRSQYASLKLAATTLEDDHNRLLATLRTLSAGA